jgi:hypothetical protein
MGLDRVVRFPIGETPSWDAIRQQLSRVGESPALRLIDGLPAFPDESPSADWKELRISTTAGMVTIRRNADSLACVVWDNADSALEAAWSRVIWACAAAGDGLIDCSQGPVTADDFARSSALSPE